MRDTEKAWTYSIAGLIDDHLKDMEVIYQIYDALLLNDSLEKRLVSPFDLVLASGWHMNPHLQIYIDQYTKIHSSRSRQLTIIAIFREATMILDHILLPSWNLSYADDVLKDITKPNTVPNTVNI